MSAFAFALLAESARAHQRALTESAFARYIATHVDGAHVGAREEDR